MTEPTEFEPTLHFDTADSGEGRSAVVVWPGAEPVLADLVSTFGHLGFRVASHDRLPDRVMDGGAASVHRFGFEATDFVLGENAARLVEGAFEAGCRGETEFDGFTGLVAAAGLSWRQAALVRAAGRYLGQVGLRVSEPSLVAILRSHTGFVRALVAHFEARFAPGVDDREATASAAAGRVADAVAAATTLDEDLVLRAMASFVSATVRTNWFQSPTGDGSGHKAYASFKLDPSLLSISTPVVPYREIFVHSTVVEGSHVRGGAVARGGLRLSDRADDYRTEVLGLMKTQTVKNALIVPVGAKGAFVVRGAATSPREAYVTFVNGLLDVTDNMLDSAVSSDPETVAYDGPDPYLVVAADKGTARFSDTANEVARARGFWLGDAFASGGSAGYDHKGMGITARGAWVSVRRHFEEAGLDVDTDEFTAVGIGDMSGDVFGNGMLLSRKIRLVGAFDHRHIFLDPEPDAEQSYLERSRLATIAGGSWDDYDRAAISAGGGVWSRSAKSVPLSPQVRRRLGVDATELPPSEVVRALLRTEVDLLWNGGIGTYVKASAQSDPDAADPHNHSVRVDADEVRCRVVGEGGNLGFTQAARVEFARRGGRINADFIDNAAGVCTSDLEVNIKVALDAAVRAGSLDAAERDTLLAAVTDDVADAVLADARRQTLAISLAEAHAPFLLSRHDRLIANLESEAGISRTAEALPTRSELAARARQGSGLTRPEIAVLLAQSKNLVRRELLSSKMIDDGDFSATLSRYFPQLVRDRVPVEIAGHRLARDIVAVRLAGELVDRVGPGMIRRLEERLGASTAEIVRGYAAVSEVLGVDELWESVVDLRDVAPAARFRLLAGVQEVIEGAVSWLLRVGASGAPVTRFAAGIAELRRALPGPSGVLDADLAALRTLGEALPLSVTAERFALPVPLVAQAHRELGRRLGLDWLTENLEVGREYWESRAAGAARDDLTARWHGLLREELANGGPVDAARAGRVRALVDELRGFDRVELAHVCVVNAELGRAIHAAA
ncbi:NAD-glutamate dehydrogenase [Rhodococcus spelaei]|uniref:NAD-glutamate dehydrogenase n=1 Tax=Rhodococcus spelaei TaxID=2546320 RepID=A0A541BMX2_9NOCA|nr:NAD-glutamate dehydrogenase [Rhodococcus spelaei]